jgi:glycosyltransferase involved in cell wall biosynthesis
MKISLIIPAHNEEKYIENCLLSVQKNGKDFFEVIVIDNVSTDKTSEIVKSFSFARVVHESQKGLPFARNRGIKEAKGDIIAYADADTQIPKGWVKKIIKEFQKDKKMVSMSGPYIYYDVSMLQKILVWMYWIILAWPSYLFIGYMAVLGNFVARKDALEKVGGFNQDVVFYGDDTDISKKLHKLGKVKFFQTFYMLSSARRLKGEGILITAYRYVINFLWIVFMNKPKTKIYKDIR